MEKESSTPKKEDPPKLITIDITPELYKKTKQEQLLKQNAFVRQQIQSLVNFLKGLQPLDVLDSLEKHFYLDQAYKQQPLNPYRISAAAARGILKYNKKLKERLLKEVINLEYARLVLRFENPVVWKILRDVDPEEEYLRGNIEGLKKILGLIEEKKA